jgi:hypothetical protein
VPPTRVTWTIEPIERGARVTLVHDGFARAEDMSDYPYGWTSFLGALQADVERHARPFELAQAVAVLERTPEILRAWLRGMDARWFECDEGPGTFSPREVLGHLVHRETTDWMPRVRRILQDGESVSFEPFDRFAHRELYANLSVNELCARFARLRRRNLAELRELSLDDATLARRGRHPALGTVTLRAARHLGRARSHAHPSDRAYDGEALPGRGRAVEGVLADPRRVSAAPRAGNGMRAARDCGGNRRGCPLFRARLT